MVFVAIIVVIQFIKTDNNISAGEQKNALTTKYIVPDTVAAILDVACKDCHSNNTKYPWYNAVQPISWWLNDHINDGKKHLNFDEFTTYTLKRQDHKLEELIESQEEGWMPLNSYTWLHKNAELTKSQKKTVINWAIQIRKEIQANPEFQEIIPESKQN